MKKSIEFMDGFMKKLENNQYNKDSLSQIDEGFVPSDVSIADSLVSYGTMIQTNIFEQVTSQKELIKTRIN